ncbi:unnamed protein product [Closterium sp. NIES-65]|nr:unnamed protein product [Closterium sp. NIES-65]
MDPSARRDPELEHSAESAPREPAPAETRPRLPAHPSASEPVHRFERVQTLPHQPASRLSPPEYSWAPARVASNRPDGQQPQQRGRSPQRHPQRQPSPRRLSPARREHYQRREGDPRSPERPRSPRRPSPRGRAGQRSPRARSPAQQSPRRAPATRGKGSPGRRWESGRREPSPPRPNSGGSAGRRGRRNGGGRGSSGRQPDPALDHAANTFVDVVRQARASGGPTHVHIEVTNGPPFAADPGPVAPLRAPMLAEYLPARVGRPDYRSPRQVPGFSAGCLTVGRVPGWSASFPLEEQTAPHPNPVGRDPMLTMCRILNLAEACEVVANLQLAVCGATRNFPSSFGPGSRGSCVTLAGSLESPLAPVSEAPAGVAPLARTFPRHVGDLVGAAQAGTPLDVLQSSAHLLLAVSACMRSMLEMEGAEPYTMRLDNNVFSGALPPTICTLSNLTVLAFSPFHPSPFHPSSFTPWQLPLFQAAGQQHALRRPTANHGPSLQPHRSLSGALPATLGKPLPAVSHPFLPAYSYLPVALSHLCFPSTPPLSPRELHSNQLSGALPATLGKLSLLKALTINATAQPCPASSSLCLVSQSASSSFCHLCPEFCSSCEPLEEMAVENEGESGSDGNGGSGGGLSMAAIIAVVCGFLLLLTAVLVAFLVWCCCRPGSNPFKHVKVVDQEEFDDAGLIPSLCCRYSLVEIRRATGNWSEENRIGSGQHSNVYKGTCPYNPASTWAVKRYKERSTHFEKEVEQIASKWHPTLAHLLGYCVDSDTRVLRRLKSRLLGYCVNSDARVEGGRMVQGESRADQLTHPCVCPLVPCPLPPLKPHQVEQIASKWRAGWCRWRSRADQLTHPCVRPLPCTLVAHPITLPNHQVEQIASKWHPNLAHLLGYCADSNTRVEGGRMVQVEEQIGSPPTPVFALPVPCLPPNQVEQIASKWHPNLAHLLGYCVDSDTRVEGGRMVQVEEQIAVYEYVHHGDLSRYLYQAESFRASFALFGVIFLELLTGRPPFIQVQAEHGEDHEHIADWAGPLIDEGKTEELKDPHLDVPESSFLSLAELAIRCTAMPFTDRPPMGEVLATLKAIRTDFFGLTDPDDVYGGEGSGGMESGFGGGDGDGDARPDWGVTVNGV